MRPARPAFTPAPLCLAALVLAAASPAGALDRFEIQVYEPDIDDPGQPSLELHLNYTFRGVRDPGYPGEVPPHRVARMTLEPAVGVASWLELGAYLQFLLAPGGDARFGGSKARAKMVLPEETRRSLGIPVFLGLNVEVGKVPVAVEQEGWANEFRPIVGWRGGRWLVSLNPIFGYALSGPDRFRVDLEPCGKVSWNTQRGFALGVEYYAGLGLVEEGFLPRSEQEHLVFAVLDLTEPVGAAPAAGGTSPWELNLAVGAGLTEATPQHLLVKAIVGRSF